MRKKLSIAGVIRLFILIGILVLMLVTIQNFDKLTASVGFSFVAIGILLVVMDLLPILLEEAPESYQLVVVVNGQVETHEFKREDIFKKIYMLINMTGTFKVVGFAKVKQ